MPVASSYLSNALLDWMLQTPFGDRWNMKLPPELQKPWPKHPMHTPRMDNDPPTLGVPTDPLELRRQITEALSLHPLWYSGVNETGQEISPRVRILTKVIGIASPSADQTMFHLHPQTPIDMGPFTQTTMLTGVRVSDREDSPNRIIITLDKRLEALLGDTFRVNDLHLTLPNMWRFG